MKLTDKINASFAAYGLFYGAVLGITVTAAFYIAEDAILDAILLQAVEQVEDAASQGRSTRLPAGTTLYEQDVPGELATLPPGRHEIAQYRHVAVFPHPGTGQLLYLVLDETAAGLDIVLSRILFGTLVVLVIAVVVGVLLARLVSRALLRPMNRLIGRIDSLDMANPQLEPLAGDDEIVFLSERFSSALSLLNEHDRRERDFTRFASHELRSPITVLSGTTSILRAETGLSKRGERALGRAESAVSRMSRLVETFLFLGRSSDEFSRKSISAEELAEEIRTLVSARAESGDRLDLSIDAEPGRFFSSPLLLSIVLENLVGNAAQHGTGQLHVRVAPPEITMTNPVADGATRGHGFGIEIAERICERLGFDLDTGRQGDRFTARIRANESDPLES